MADLEDFYDIAEVREVYNMNARNPRVFRMRINAFEKFNAEEFRKRYRLSKDCVRHVLNLIQEDLYQYHNTDASPELQLLVTLKILCKGLLSGDLHGLSQPTVSVIVNRVSQSIARLLPRYIKFPQRTEPLQVDFYNISHFPRVVGCVDGTHILIKCPSRERAQLYINRKGFYSLNVQVVCDANKRILNIVACWRGSTHDSRIWDTCELRNKFEANRIDGIILGDSGYPCRPYLLTPILNPRTVPEQNYNNSHIRTRNVVERCFGEWKGMFRALQNGLHISLPRAKTAIVAMAVLYNIRKEFGDDELYGAESDDEVEENEVGQHHPMQEPHHQPPDGPRHRADFIRRYFERNL